MGRANANQALLDQGESLYNQCLEYDANHADCHRGLAVLLVETRRPDAAFRLLEGWATRQPQTADAKIELARLYEEFGDKETAKSHLEEALVADTTSARAWTALGKLREESGDYAQALANYQRSYQLNNLQPAIASRIAALNSSLRAGTALAPPDGTRMVTQPGPANR
jgi:FimV-like protein